MNDTFGWCFIGCGKIARRAMGDLTRCSRGFRLAAVYARNAERASAFAAEYGATAYATAEEAILAPSVRAVYVCTTNPYHKEYSLLAIRLGKPVLCEKPAALTLAEAREVVDAARARGVYYMEGMWTRHLPAIRQAIDWAGQGAIGEVKSLRASFAMPFPYDPKHRLFDPAQGGGALLDIGVYTLALACFFFNAMPCQITACAERAPTGVDAAAACILRYPNDAIARLYFSVAANEPNDAVIAGETGYIRLPHRFWAARQACLGREEKEEVFNGEYAGAGLQTEFEAVRDDVNAGRTQNALVTHALTLSVMALVDQIRLLIAPGNRIGNE